MIQPPNCASNSALLTEKSWAYCSARGWTDPKFAGARIRNGPSERHIVRIDLAFNGVVADGLLLGLEVGAYGPRECLDWNSNSAANGAQLGMELVLS